MEQIKLLQAIRSVNTSLISYYLPQGSDTSNIGNHISYELSTSNNIKSKQTRKAVQTALRSLQHHLKGIKAIPMNGLAIFVNDESYV
jgi:peptide chain release factor subunit 1